jgi:hypothetical protein
MSGTRELSFELERFEWAADDRLEVSGRWHGLTGRKLARPVLTVEAGGRRTRLNAMPGGQLPGAGGEAWRAAFAWPDGPADVESAELEIGRSVIVELPAPRRRKRASRSAGDEGLRAELAELREQIAELRRSRDVSPAAQAVAESAEAVAESAEAEAEAAEAQLAEAEAEPVTEAPPEPDPELTARLEAAEAELAELRERYEQLRADHDTLGDQHAALIARSGDLRGELADVIDELDAARAALDVRDAELAGHQEEAERRLEEERARTDEVRDELAAARDEAQRALEAESAETGRVRAELASAREEAERALAAERAEVASLRSELAARPEPAEDGAIDPDDTTREMYERIAEELQQERATTSRLRQELDRRSAESAQGRRAAASSDTNGVHTTDEAPVPLTPAGRSGRRSAAVLASRAEADPRAPYRRVDAARAAAAQRVPEHAQSATGVWVARAAAFALVALLLVALIIIVSSVL